MKKSKKKIAFLLAGMLAMTVFTSCGQAPGDAGSESRAESAGASATATDKGESQKIVMAYIGNEQPNQDAVLGEVKKLVKEKLNVDFETIQLGFGDYQNKLNLMLSGGDELDILPVFYTVAGSYMNAGQIVNLGDYVDEYGKDILTQMGEDVAKSGSINGFIYGIPANKESASLSGIVMRKDIVDELKIDVAAIKTHDDLTEVYAKVKAAHPELDMIAGSSIANYVQTTDPLLDTFGVLMDQGQDTKVVNWYETQEYTTRAKRVNDWYKAGYVKMDAATTTETNANLVKAGTLFSYLSSIKPGYLIQENVSCGREMVVAYIGQDNGEEANVICSTNTNFFNWGIAQQSKDKQKAMEFLNFAYTSPEWNNLMNFGIEGEDYAKVEGSEVFIDYPTGKDQTSAYHLNMGWMLPNQFIGYVWNGQPEDIWQQYKDFNASATYSKAFGFMYDASTVSTELTALNSVKEEFFKPLETGSVSSVEDSLEEFNQKLYAAGLQKVIDLKQQQLDAWLKTK